MVVRCCGLLCVLLGHGPCNVSSTMTSALRCLTVYPHRITIQDHALNRMTTAWLLPVVTLIVASSSGGVLAPALLKFSLPHALLTITVSAFMVVIGLSLALVILTIYLLRLIVHGLPSGASILSVFLPLGPCGQAGFSFVLIGQSFKTILPLKETNSEFLASSTSGEIINVLCICVAFALWSFAVMWIVFALLGVRHVLARTRFPFAVTFWGLIFPNVCIPACLPSARDDVRAHFRACSRTSLLNLPKFSIRSSSAFLAPFTQLALLFCG
jgi:tellurite resistance protein TehA-like permease